MELKPGTYCPLIKKDCIQLKCAWFTQVRGTNPNTGKEVDEWACAITWLPILTIENSQQQRQTGAAVESLRNSVVKKSFEEKREMGYQFIDQSQVRLQQPYVALIENLSEEDENK
jgi:hypothetical protein